ncbi:MAG TPA: aminodeoxychorismate synthase component I, partial [bacterium]|nr:aminodeoxychorismate synthase component I [bacterium]
MNAKVLLRGSGWHAGADRGWRFPIRSVIQADRVEDVPAVLEEVERATRAGLTAVGFVSYEAAAAFGLPAREPCPYPLPFAWFGFCRKEDIQKRTEEEFDPDYHPGEISTPEITIPATPDCFADTLDQLKACLAAGETYQVNYTLRAGVRGSLTGPALFHRLYRAQPVPYAAYLATDEWEILSLSPELFLQRSGGLLLSRPMKGTWRRGRTLDEDALHAERLRTSDKERAENLMIVDMVRNDLGRLCRPGSITTGPLFEIETYRSVLQMTGTVQGIVKENVSLHEIFTAVFPAASITGAPKHRTMEIIRRVEPEPRGVYCGVIGWIHPGGDFTFNVAIRTLYGRPGNYTLGVGGGIVWDSDARREYEEIQTKIAFLQDGAFAFSLLETLRLKA